MKQREDEMEKKSRVQQKEIHFTFETSFHGLISTSGHIFLIYGVGVPRLAPLRPDSPPCVFRHFIGSTSRFETRWIFNTVVLHHREISFPKKNRISLMTKIAFGACSFNLFNSSLYINCSMLLEKRLMLGARCNAKEVSLSTTIKREGDVR